MLLTAAWVLVGALATWHTLATREYVQRLAGLGHPEPAAPTPLRRTAPGSFADLHAWLRYALATQEGAGWQIRHTDIDNAPHGREVHWNSTFVHLISFAGRIQNAVTGEPLPRATENALTWFNLPLLLGCVVGFSSWVALRAGAAGGAVAAFGMVGLKGFYEGFAPNYGDHHGVLTAAAFGTLLGGFFMGAGWSRQKSELRLLPVSRRVARSGAVVSALSGAVGMWLSAASTIPVIAIVGLAGILTTFVFGRQAGALGAEVHPDLWRLWGRIGSAAACFFYLVEYAPGHLGLRLEVNHPLHALAWWGGAELIALGVAWRTDPNARLRAARVLPGVLAVLAAPLTIILAGDAAFVVRDPFVADLRHMVYEGRSFRAAVAQGGWEYAKQYLVSFALCAAGLASLLVARRDRLAIGLSALSALALVGMSCWEVRWWLAASAALLVLVLALVIKIGAGSAVRQWITALAASALLLPGGAIAGARSLEAALRNGTADAIDLLEPLYRDIAASLRRSQPEGDIVVLASPNTSDSVSYYGRFKSVGTLFWENTAGLKAAGEIFSAASDETAHELVRARGITHLALVSAGDFIDEYFRLSKPVSPRADVTGTFAHRLARQGRVPPWLRVIPYQTPANIRISGLRVLLLQVVQPMGEFDATWNRAVAQVAIGDSHAAALSFRAAIARAAKEHEARLLLAASQVAGAHHDVGLGIELFRSLLQLGPNPQVAAELAWLLSSAGDPALRDGREALSLAEPLAREHPRDLVVLNAYAGALAENSRYPEAVAVTERAIAIARAAGYGAAVVELEERRDSYRGGRPWRQ